MHPLVKRIAVNGLLTAVFLAVIGYGFAELASFWLAGVPGVRPGEAKPDSVLRDSLRYQVPLAMAGWGFAFIVVCEAGLYLWRGKRAAKPAAVTTEKPDPAEVLLEELLRQAEAARAPQPAPSPATRAE